jgi:hypothetical protein
MEAHSMQIETSTARDTISLEDSADMFPSALALLQFVKKQASAKDTDQVPRHLDLSAPVEHSLTVLEFREMRKRNEDMLKGQTHVHFVNFGKGQFD